MSTQNKGRQLTTRGEITQIMVFLLFPVVFSWHAGKNKDNVHFRCLINGLINWFNPSQNKVHNYYCRRVYCGDKAAPNNPNSEIGFVLCPCGVSSRFVPLRCKFVFVRSWEERPSMWEARLVQNTNHSFRYIRFVIPPFCRKHASLSPKQFLL